MDLWRILRAGVDNVVLAPPKLDPLRKRLASSQVTIDAAPRLDRLNKGVDCSSFMLPFRGYPLQPLISPPGTIMTSVVRLGGVESEPKYGQVHGGGSNNPSSELRDLAVNVVGARRPSLPSSSEALLGLWSGVFGSHVEDGLRRSWSIEDGELEETLIDPGVSIPPRSETFVL